MERFIKGDVVVIPFPFSDLTSLKRRPALVLADLEGEDIILCQITSKNLFDKYSIPLAESDFEQGSLHKNSNIRPNRLFTADKSLILKKIGRINPDKHQIVLLKLFNLLTADS